MSARKTFVSALAVSIVIIVSTNCAPRSARSHAPQLAPATVRVVNYNWQDVNVYAIRGGAKHRLGTVTTMASGVYKIPQYLYRTTGWIKFRVEPIGSNENFTSLPIPCDPGRRIEWRIQKILDHSSAMVY